LGFGFVEVGTVTPRPQSGNPKPRLFRLPADGALINRMGFNNEGASALELRLKKKKNGIIVGTNIGKNKDTPNKDAHKDYLLCLERLYDYSDYFVVNVSSPNTPNLRELQERDKLMEILDKLQNFNFGKKNIPILLKIAPDLSESQASDVVKVVKNCRIAGVVATNTTIDRAGLKTSTFVLEKIGAGGLSGKPVLTKSTSFLRLFSDAGIETIGVGGIHSVADARKKWESGAQLIQVYTGFVYEGPRLIAELVRDFAEIRSGLRS
jgi:dihydroorotate dehydrogenase